MMVFASARMISNSVPLETIIEFHCCISTPCHGVASNPNIGSDPGPSAARVVPVALKDLDLIQTGMINPVIIPGCRGLSCAGL